MLMGVFFILVICRIYRLSSIFIGFLMYFLIFIRKVIEVLLLIIWWLQDRARYIIGWIFILLLIVIGWFFILCMLRIVDCGLFRIGVFSRELKMLLLVMVKVFFDIFLRVSLLLCVLVVSFLILYLIFVKDSDFMLCIGGIIRLFGVEIVMEILVQLWYIRLLLLSLVFIFGIFMSVLV